jgi:hypothetical protein
MGSRKSSSFWNELRGLQCCYSFANNPFAFGPLLNGDMHSASPSAPPNTPHDQAVPQPALGHPAASSQHTAGPSQGAARLASLDPSMLIAFFSHFYARHPTRAVAYFHRYRSSYPSHGAQFFTALVTGSDADRDLMVNLFCGLDNLDSTASHLLFNDIWAQREPQLIQGHTSILRPSSQAAPLRLRGLLTFGKYSIISFIIWHS